MVHQVVQTRARDRMNPKKLVRVVYLNPPFEDLDRCEGPGTARRRTSA